MFRKIYKRMLFSSAITLLIAVCMVFSACYYVFNGQMEKAIRLEANTIAAYWNPMGSDTANIEAIDTLENVSFAVVSRMGDVFVLKDDAGILDIERQSHSVAVKTAIDHGAGEERHYTKGSTSKIYTYAQTLDDDRILILSTPTLDIGLLVSELFAVILFTMVLICIFTAILAKTLTERIIEPLDRISLSEIDEKHPPYQELKPFISKIAYQSREITHQMERVKRQKLRLQAVSDSMSEGLIVLDKDGNILSLNHSAMLAFGVTDAEAVKTAGISVLSGTDREFSAHLQNAYKGIRGSFYYTVSGKTFDMFYSPVSDKDNIMGVVILMFDMTEKVRNEQIRTEFTANVSHELKTPLTSIHGYAQLITSGIAKETGDMRECAGKIEKESRRLIMLVEDIIKLSNLDEGAEPEKEGFSVRTMLAEIIDTLSINAQSRGVTFSLIGDDFEIMASQSQIHELLYNIIDNAVKYNKENGSVRITVGKETVTIADTGIGIPEEYKERVFERFFRVDKSHSKTVNGTGLGLSIVKHIAMNNDIVIKVDSEVGKGSIFYIDFTKCLAKIGS